MATNFFHDRRILVTGGAGFLGSEVVRQLREKGCEQIVAPRQREYDLTREAQICRLLEQAQPDLVIHLAAAVGGIGANRQHPGRVFFTRTC